MSTVPEEGPSKRRLSIRDIGIPWFGAWIAVVVLSAFIGYRFGFHYGEERGWNAGTTKFQEWFNAEISIHKKYAEMLDVYLKYLEDKKTSEQTPGGQVLLPESSK
jgi:hypothetical protein